MLTQQHRTSPLPAEIDVHLSVVLRGVRMDYRACRTAALVFVREWREKNYADTVSVSVDGIEGSPRLPCETLYLDG